MKLISVFIKSLKEQIRHFWILILTISMAPFFVFIYYLITQASRVHYDLLIINQDKGVEYLSTEINYGDLLLEAAQSGVKDAPDIPLRIKITDHQSAAIEDLKNKKADALVIIPENFSASIQDLILAQENAGVNIEFVGDLTNINYMVSAIWADEILNDFIYQTTQKAKPVNIKETSLGISGNIDDFDLLIPGILILAVIVVMFSATIALVTEVEHKTILRLKLSKISAFEFLSGVGIVQVLVGVISILLTLITAQLLGFNYAGSLGLLMLIAVLTSISMIAFSLIIAALTKTANEVLIVGNFPLFLFMFFTGAAFPIKGKELFSLAGYPITIHGLMSPTHAVTALNKVLIMNMGLKDILPEMTALIILTLLYFVIGIWVFKYRHMKIA